MIKKFTKAALAVTLLVSAGAVQASGTAHYGNYGYDVILSQLGVESYPTPTPHVAPTPTPRYHDAVYDPYGNLEALLGTGGRGHCGYSCTPVSPEY